MRLHCEVLFHYCEQSCSWKPEEAKRDKFRALPYQTPTSGRPISSSCKPILHTHKHGRRSMRSERVLLHLGLYRILLKKCGKGLGRLQDSAWHPMLLPYQCSLSLTTCRLATQHTIAQHPEILLQPSADPIPKRSAHHLTLLYLGGLRIHDSQLIVITGGRIKHEQIEVECKRLSEKHLYG